MKTLPKANIQTNKVSDAKLIKMATSLHNGMVAQVLVFPDPPITMVSFLGFITAYKTASGKAVKGTTQDTENKTDAKTDLINNMRSIVQYINQVVYDTYQAAPSTNYASLRALILSAGIKAKRPNTRPNTSGNNRVPVTLNTKTNTNNTMVVRVKARKKYDPQAVNQYWMQYRLKVTPVPAWTDVVSTKSRIEVDAISAGTYQYRVSGRGGISRGNVQTIWSNIQEVIVLGTTF